MKQKMKQKKWFSASEWRTYLAIMVTLSLLCVLVVFACFQYYTKLQETVRAESGGYLQEISKQIGVNASKSIEDNFSILGTVATVLQRSNVNNFTQLAAIVQDQQQHWDFQRILLVDVNGVAYDAHGQTMLLGSDAYLQEVIVAHKRAMSTSQMMGNMECVVFAMPLDNLVVDGKQMSAVLATYDVSTFDQILSMTAFDGTGYGHIIRRDGTVVIRSSSPAAHPTGYNILASLANVPFAGAVDAQRLLSDIANGQAGQAEITLDGVPLYMAYTPLEMQEWYLLTFVPVAVANAKSAILLKITGLLCTLIALAFGILLAIIMFTAYRHKRELEQLAYVDPVTEGNTMQCFYVQAAALLSAQNAPQYALVYTNIKKFKMLNEQLGRAACDMILCSTAKSIQQDLTEDECMGRLFADNFCILLRYEGEADLAQRLANWNENYNGVLRDSGATWLPHSVDIGVYIIESKDLPVADMVDRAKIALRETPREVDAQVHYTIYDERVRRRLLREKHLEDMMLEALEKQEFQVYLQPKYGTASECIGGAEALVRWQSPSEGMIYPDEFITLFEKNGFIISLDLWVFEQVCQTLCAWLEAGHTPMRISVNCSRMNLKTPGFLARYRRIFDRYNIPANLLEIELTESVVFEDVVHLTKTIDEIHALGFGCAMDDFGSGYSSLNFIRDIPVDVLKLDRIFFCSSTADVARTESVVGSIITMARALAMTTVAEGVEERFQVEMLKRLGCDYIQGYYFAKPMPIGDFEVLAFGEKVSV